MKIFVKYVPFVGYDTKSYSYRIVHDGSVAIILLASNDWRACACCMSEETREVLSTALAACLPSTVTSVCLQAPGAFAGFYISENEQTKKKNTQAQERLRKHGLGHIVFTRDYPEFMNKINEWEIEYQD